MNRRVHAHASGERVEMNIPRRRASMTEASTIAVHPHAVTFDVNDVRLFRDAVRGGDHHLDAIARVRGEGAKVNHLVPDDVLPAGVPR